MTNDFRFYNVFLHSFMIVKTKLVIRYSLPITRNTNTQIHHRDIEPGRPIE